MAREIDRSWGDPCGSSANDTEDPRTITLDAHDGQTR